VRVDLAQGIDEGALAQLAHRVLESAPVALPLAGAVRQRLLSERSMSQNQLAELSHWDPGYLSRVLNGRKPGTHALAADLDRVLGADGELLGIWTAGHACPALTALADPGRAFASPDAAAGIRSGRAARRAHSFAIRALGEYPGNPEVAGFAGMVRSRLPVA
jgi:transcriptional regulator with XRE-family HTH domain